jgi:hypothetical protein
MITGAADCCARASNGQAAAVPPSKVMKSRRRMTGPPAIKGADYHIVN